MVLILPDDERLSGDGLYSGVSTGIDDFKPAIAPSRVRQQLCADQIRNELIMSPKVTASSSTTKSARRIKIIDQLLDVMKSDDIFRTLDYRHKKESYIKQYMHQPLKARLIEIHRSLSPKTSEDTLKRKARESLDWEGDKQTTINHTRFLGVQHRPDFRVRIDGLKIAVEVKRGENGQAVREGIGQSLVYVASDDYDFIIYIFIDTSKDKKIRESIGRELEVVFVNSLWDRFNVRFAVV